MDSKFAFESLAPSAIKSIRQRDLLNTWLRAYAARGGVPKFETFNPERMADEIPDLVFCRIEHRPGQPSIIIESDGSRLSDAYGRRGKGQELSTYLGPRHAPNVMPIYFECIERQLPTYSISKLSDTNGVRVDYERLVLPFSDSDDHIRVTRILSSPKAISEDGSFVLHDLMRNSVLSEYKLRGVIDRELAHKHPVRGGDVGAIEFV